MESLKLTDTNQASRKAYDLVVEKKTEALNAIPTEISLPPDLSLPTRSTDLPSIEIRDHLVDTYFTYRYPIWPIVHKTIFLSQLHDPNSTPSLLLLNALFAYASRYSTWQVLRADPDKPETAGQLFLERAQAMLPAFLMAPRLSTVQALLFLAQLEDNATQRHTYHSMAVRMAQLLDLHKNCQHLGLPDDEKETRRCIWWTCYMNDRLLALSTRKPAIIHDGDCNIDLPFQEHIYDGPGNNSVSLSHYYSPPQLFYQFLLLSKIVGGVLKHFTKVANKRYRSSDAHEVALTSLDESLFTWLASLPDHLQYTPASDALTTKTLPSPYVAALHLYFYSILDTLHNPYMDSSNPRATSDMPQSPPSLERCTLAASMITGLSRSLCFQPQYGLNFGTQCYAILHAAIMHLTNTANTTSYQSLKSK
ncbi:fungal-specific transcription factor domain-containing protein, partial [Dissophora ornata]